MAGLENAPMRIPIRRIAFFAICLPVWVFAQDPQLSSTQQSQTSQTQKQRPKDDVNAIGSRKLGSKGIGNWYSLEAEISLGRQYAEEIEANARLLSDPFVGEYVNRVGQNLVRNSDAKVPFTIKIIDSDEVNAFALPGGFMFVNTGAIMAAQDEAELAGIMAHEIAHVAARHATRQMTRSNFINFASIPLIFAGGGIGLAVRELFVVAGPLTKMKFSRSFESEADYLGVQYVYKAGYDPQSFVSLLERLDAEEKQRPGKLELMLGTHPQIKDRLKKIQTEMSAILPPAEMYILTTSDFDNAQARLRSLVAGRRVLQKDTQRPILRKTTTPSSPDAQADTQSDEKPPILKRSDKLLRSGVDAWDAMPINGGCWCEQGGCDRKTEPSSGWEGCHF
jgi:predicted Zn-dependent protease